MHELGNGTLLALFTDLFALLNVSFDVTDPVRNHHNNISTCDYFLIKPKLLTTYSTPDGDF